MAGGSSLASLFIQAGDGDLQEDLGKGLKVEKSIEY